MAQMEKQLDFIVDKMKQDLSSSSNYKLQIFKDSTYPSIFSFRFFLQ